MSDSSTIFGPYRLLQMLGRGGMGEVYRAYDTEHQRTVAVKRLAAHLADDADFQLRFRREAHNVAQLSNPHIVPIHKYGEIDGHLYIDMRLVEGGDLDQLVQGFGALPFGRAVAMLEQIASGLDAAHANGLVHRDVKPSNVLLDAQVVDFCYLADFGITKAASAERSNSLTRSGALLGSLAYMAPEQFDGGATKQSDVYALTCVFFELITGRKPYEGEGLPTLMHSHMKVPPPRPSKHNPGAALFDEVVVVGMAKQASSRFHSAGSLARAARAALEAHRSRDTVVPAPSSTPGEGSRPNTIRAGAAPQVVWNEPWRWVGAVDGEPVRDPADTPVPAPATGAGGVHMDSAPTVRFARDDADPDGSSHPAMRRPAPEQSATALPPDGQPEDAPSRAAGILRVLRGSRWLMPLGAVVLIVALVAVIWAVDRTGVDAASSTDAGPVLNQAVFTGRTSGNELTLAVAIKDGRAVGYICDGTTRDAWLEGSISGTQLTLHDNSQQDVLEADVGPRLVLGKVFAFGSERGFSADIASGRSGLYEYVENVDGITERIGWIVLPDGTTGVHRQGDDRAGAPPLDTATRTAVVDGRTVVAEVLSGASTVLPK